MEVETEVIEPTPPVTPITSVSYTETTEPVPHKRSQRSIQKLKKPSTCERLCHQESIFAAGKRTFKKLPFRIWAFFIEAFLIPRHRPEWGKYAIWNPVVPSEPPAKKRSSKRQSSLWKQKTQIIKTLANAPPKPIAHDHSGCLIIRINVSGQIFEPQVRTLSQFPSTLLGNPKRMLPFYDPERDEFFFDRNRTCFEGIMYYFQTGGIIRRPNSVNLDMFLDEVRFFDLGEKVVGILEATDGVSTEEEKPLPKNLLMRKLWLLMEYPESSYQSRIVAYCSILVVCISVFEFCIETLPVFAWTPDDRVGDEYVVVENEDVAFEAKYDLQDPFFMTETMCIIFFVFEYLIRALTSPNFFHFVKDLTNLIDLVAILPYFLNILYNIPDESTSKGSKPSNKTVSLTILRIIRLVRVFRILKLSRHNRGLKILGKTLKASIRELGLLVFFLFIGVIVFSSMMYFSEANVQGSPFTSIPAGFWYSVVTMTTLGYGDMVPTRLAGKVVGSLCAIAGVLTISLPVPVIVSNFNTFYNREEMNKDTTAPECDHVKHCPFYPAWYSKDGQPIGDRTSNLRHDTGNSASRKWLFGEQRPDLSDDEFEGLKYRDIEQTTYSSKKHKPKNIRAKSFRQAKKK